MNCGPRGRSTIPSRLHCSVHRVTRFTPFIALKCVDDTFEMSKKDGRGILAREEVMNKGGGRFKCGPWTRKTREKTINPTYKGGVPHRSGNRTATGAEKRQETVAHRASEGKGHQGFSHQRPESRGLKAWRRYPAGSHGACAFGRKMVTKRMR